MTFHKFPFAINSTVLLFAEEKEYFDDVIKRVNELRNIVRDRRTKAQHVYETYYNMKHHTKKPSFATGDIVLLQRCEVRATKFTLLYGDNLYQVRKVYQSETYGQLLRIMNLKTRNEVRELIHSDRLKQIGRAHV